MTISILIEWDNPRLAGADRAARMMRTLAVQLRAAADAGLATFEVLLGGAEQTLSTSLLERICALWQESARGRPPLQIHRLPLEDSSYYQLKNLLADRAQGEILIFLDSDVIPESGWLLQILRPFCDPAVQVVCSNSYVELSSLFGRIMALIWFFPLRSADGSVKSTERFFANSVAFRRELFLRYHFPRAREMDRGSCLLLAGHLRESGIGIYENPEARVTHPAPNGCREFLVRALGEGRDAILRFRMSGTLRTRSHWFRSGCERLSQAVVRTTLQYRNVGLQALHLPAVFAVGVCFYSLCLCGATIAFINPRFARLHFRL